MLIVKKFGGSSVADAERVRHVAGLIAAEADRGNKVVVVLSAQGKTTDQLIAKAHELAEEPLRRELDMLLTIGEQESVALMAIALNGMGYKAVSLNAFQVPMMTTAVYGNARLETVDSMRIINELDQGKIVLVTGFQGINKYGDLTTLGRGGSDTTAVALAAALSADRCQIYTDVPGVFTADPRVVPNARCIPEIGYNEMLEMASTGAKVLHNRCVELAKKYQVVIEVLSSMEDAPGTLVKEDSKVEKMLISGVSADRNMLLCTIFGMKNEPGQAFRLFQRLGAAGINVDLILQSVPHEGQKCMAFTFRKEDEAETRRVISEYAEETGGIEAFYRNDLAKVSVIGAGMTSNPGIAGMVFEAMYDVGINIVMISTSEIKISVLVAAEDADAAVRSIHDRFRLYEGR